MNSVNFHSELLLWVISGHFLPWDVLETQIALRAEGSHWDNLPLLIFWKKHLNTKRILCIGDLGRVCGYLGAETKN